MADPSPLLDFLREQFARLNTKLDDIASDVRGIGVRPSGLEADARHVRIGMGELSVRMDSTDRRLERIERRLDLVNVPAS